MVFLYKIEMTSVSCHLRSSVAVLPRLMCQGNIISTKRNKPVCYCCCSSKHLPGYRLFSLAACNSWRACSASLWRHPKKLRSSDAMWRTHRPSHTAVLGIGCVFWVGWVWLRCCSADISSSRCVGAWLLALYLLLGQNRQRHKEQQKTVQCTNEQRIDS